VIRFLKYITAVIAIAITVGCSMAESKTTTVSNIIDFGDPNAKKFATRLKSLADNKKTNQVVNITQFGDSHSAADFFTGEFRTLMQQKYGNAGIGWITPVAIKGQSHAAVTWKSKNWDVLSSRTLSNLDFPMGGFIAKPSKDSATIQIVPRGSNNKDWQIKLTFKTLKNNSRSLTLYDTNDKKINLSYTPTPNVWQTASVVAKMPLVIKGQKDMELGGIWLTRNQHSGVIVSSIATNGAKQTIWQKWGKDWFKELAISQSDLVILEYGTNESFDETLDANQYRKNLVSNIRLIRKNLPNAAILIMTPPDTMANEKNMPKSFAKIMNIQKQVAKSEKTLFWDWQVAMGGQFSIKQWRQRGLARPDLVHQTLKGYKESARIFYADLNEFIRKNS
jgi:lysophospholipase L1-like esterase